MNIVVGVTDELESNTCKVNFNSHNFVSTHVFVRAIFKPNVIATHFLKVIVSFSLDICYGLLPWIWN